MNLNNCNPHTVERTEVLYQELSNDRFYINSPCFLTVPPRTVEKYGIYLKSEGNHFDAIKILNVHYKSGFVYLTIQDLKSNTIHQINHKVDENSPCVWWLLSWEYFENETMKRIKQTFR